MSERREIAGWPDCWINERGEVWRGERQKATPIAKNGYRTVNFSKNNKSHTMYIHRLLLTAFVGPCPEGHEALHINGNRLDNRLENLRWGTRKENVADAIKHGTATIGTKNAQAKLTEIDLSWIKDMHDMGFFAREIAPHFGVSKTTISRVTRGETYRKEYA